MNHLERRLSSSHCRTTITFNSLLCALYGPVESLVHMPLQIMMVKAFQLTVSSVETCLLNVSYLNWKALLGISYMWFQQDGATYHTKRKTIFLLRETFGNLSKWTCSITFMDYTQLDYFLSECLRYQVYANKPATIKHLEANIRRVIAQKNHSLIYCKRMFENWTQRVCHISASRNHI